MPGKLSVLFIVIHSLPLEYGRCVLYNIWHNKQNLSGIGMIQKFKFSLARVLLRLHHLSLLESAKECFITSQYMYFLNYSQNWKLCDLVMVDPKGNVIDALSACVQVI